jgi:hypothetical protein
MHKSLKQKTEECIALLRSTNRDKIEDLINYITRMGYFVAPGSLKHHRFEGGLVSHSLETYRKALLFREKKIQEGFDSSEMPEDSVIIAALMHDLCKADVLRYNKDERKAYVCKSFKGHSERSVRQIGYSGFQLTPKEKDAILWHMGGEHRCPDKKKRIEYFNSHPLSDIIRKADGKSIGESKRRHHPNKYKLDA